VHPLQTAAVTYVVQRVESLMGLFYLLTLYCAIRAHEGPRAWAWTLGSWVCCAAGMATKEVMVTAPVVVVLWGYLFVPPAGGRFSRTSARLAAGLAATWLVFAALVWNEHRAPSISLDAATAWTYLLTQAGVLVHYLRLAFVPSPLAFLYDWPLAASLASVAWQAALVGVILALTVVLVVRRHPAGFVGASFFLVLAPTSSVVPILTEVAAEHRMYLPLAAVIAAVVVGMFIVGRRLRLPSTPSAAVSALALVAVVAGLGAATRERNRVYGSAESLWQDTVNVRPNDSRSRVAYADALLSRGRAADARTQLETAVTLAPDDAVARVRLGVLLARQRELDAAVTHLERALTSRPDDLDAHRWLAHIYSVQSRDRLAVEHYERALAATPDDLALLAELATVLADSSDVSVRNPPRARDLASRAARLTGGRDPRVLQILAVAQAGSGQLAEAATTARTAAGLARAAGDANLASALEYRATAYEAAARQR
jgi:protein O-mannosyl-transferase